MLAAHFSTALIPHHQLPKGTLLYLLIASQLQDFLWLTFATLGVEPTTPAKVLDATLINMNVDMLYSHDLIPLIVWGALIYLCGKVIFKSNRVGFAGFVLVIGHCILDFFSGHLHHIFGAETRDVGLGLYATDVYLAIAIEVVFTICALWYVFTKEKALDIRRTTKNKAAIIGVFVYGILFLLLVATTSFRQWFGLPDFDVGFNTTVPTLLFNYLGMIGALHYFVPRYETA